jgi:hypothetical protein
VLPKSLSYISNNRNTKKTQGDYLWVKRGNWSKIDKIRAQIYYSHLSHLRRHFQSRTGNYYLLLLYTLTNFHSLREIEKGVYGDYGDYRF